jgi:hypothetical protein
MCFDKVLKQLIAGSPIRRTSWDKGHNIRIVGRRLMVFFGTKSLKRESCLEDTDICASDWEIYQLEPI